MCGLNRKTSLLWGRLGTNFNTSYVWVKPVGCCTYLLLSIHFNTSYVWVKPLSYTDGVFGQGDFNTSYVWVKPVQTKASGGLVIFQYIICVG